MGTAWVHRQLNYHDELKGNFMKRSLIAVTFCLLAILQAQGQTTAQAREQCFSCKGTWFPRGHPPTENHLTGMCVDKKSFALTYTTMGGTLARWQFLERRDNLDGVSYHWRKPPEKGATYPIDMRIELADVTFALRYTVSDTETAPQVSLVSQCTPVNRVGQ
jgi:hypothetical protein